jgi:hypothetical protein
MLKSIDRTARMAGVSLGEVNLRGPRDWGGKNIYEKAKTVGLEDAYLTAIGGGSNSIHGNWQEIAGHHLEWDDTTGRFTPNMIGLRLVLKCRWRSAASLSIHWQSISIL